MKIVGMIPARYKSSRFPGKPLMDICGHPMIWWVYHQASKVIQFDEIYVATEDVRIFDYCKSENIPCLITSADCRNGTERICEASHKVDSDIYVTIQGDEPLVEPSNIEALIDYMVKNSEVGCATMKIRYHNPIDVINSTTPKVLSNLYDEVMIFTRSPVPYPKASLNYDIFKPVGLYGFRKELLQAYDSLPIGPIEEAEDIELLRYLENGYKIKIFEIESDTIAVDTPKDLERVRSIIKERLKK